MEELKNQFAGKIKNNYSLANITTLNIGGPAQLFLEIENEDDLIKAVKLASDQSVPYLVIGMGSNLLVSDQGFNGLIIKNSVKGILTENGTLKVKAGIPLEELVDYTIEQGLDGMSTMKGIPGTVGGAIYGSAGAYGDNIRDFLISVSCFDGKNIIKIKREKLDTGYRDSLFKHHKNLIILEAEFAGFPNVDPKTLKKESKEILIKRATKYPPETKCPGSFFKNVPIEGLSQETLAKIPAEKIKFGKIPAGYLLEAVGAKGEQIGQIKVAENHGNTFINLGNGTAADFYKLAKSLSEKVQAKFGITLEPEVQLINLPPMG